MPDVFKWIRIASRLLSAVLVILVLLLLMGRAHAECAHSAGEAKQNGAPWASWSLRIAGHKGQRCWYATGKGERHHFPRRNRREEEAQTVTALPRPRPDFEMEEALRQPRIDTATGLRLADELLPLIVPETGGRRNGRFDARAKEAPRDAQVRPSKTPLPKERPAAAKDPSLQTTRGVHPRGMAQAISHQTESEVMQPDQRSYNKSPDTRPRPVSLPAGADTVLTEALTPLQRINDVFAEIGGN